MPAQPDADAAYEAAQNRDIDAQAVELVAEARAWARRLRRCRDLVERAEASGRAQELRFLPMELAGSWRIAQTTAARWLEEADRFTTALPQTLARLETGELLVHQAQVLLRRTRHCSPDVARAVEAAVLDGADELCPADLGRRVDAAVLSVESARLEPQEAERRHVEAAAERRTWSRPDLDGMGVAGALLTAEQLAAWSAGLDALERQQRVADREAGVERTADQRRADLFAALPAMALGTAWPAAGEPAATVVLNVHVPVSTVLDLSREPGTLDGYGAVSAEHVRLLRPRAVRRVLVDGGTGRPLAVDDRTTPAAGDDELRTRVREMLRPAVVTDADEAQHDPSARLARLVDVRDVRCSGPGCSATRTHRDHHQPWPSGPTSAANLHRLSARCHAAKHDGWTVVRHPDGSTTWRSRLGRTYRRPPPYAPPPDVDVYDDPPVRARPAVETPWWHDAAEPVPPAADADDPPPSVADGPPPI